MSDSFEVAAQQTVSDVQRYTVTAGAITLHLAITSIRALRVIIAALNASYLQSKQAKSLVRKASGSIGFLEFSSEDPESLKRFETLCKQNGIEITQLPDLQPGDGKVQYIYKLDELTKLDELIHNYNSKKLQELESLKATYGTNGPEYQQQKTALEATMPSITLITADDYAHTSLKTGRDTPEFIALEADADRTLGQPTEAFPTMTNEEVRDYLQQLTANTINPLESEKTPEPVPAMPLERKPHLRRRSR